MVFSAIQERSVIASFAQILNGTGLGLQDIFPVATYAQQIDTLLCSNTDGIDHVVKLFAVAGSTQVLVGSGNVPAGAGSNNLPSTDLFAACFPVAVKSLLLAVGWHLQIAVAVTVTGANVVEAYAIGGQVA